MAPRWGAPPDIKKGLWVISTSRNRILSVGLVQIAFRYGGLWILVKELYADLIVEQTNSRSHHLNQEGDVQAQSRDPQKGINPLPSRGFINTKLALRISNLVEEQGFRLDLVQSWSRSPGCGESRPLSRNCRSDLIKELQVLASQSWSRSPFKECSSFPE